jgi:hypothetical protein
MGGMGDFEKMFKDSMKNFDFGGFPGGGFSGGGFPGSGGFSGGGFPGSGGFPGAGGQGRSRQQGRSGQQQQKNPKKPHIIPDPFTKGEESGVAVLTKEKFPGYLAKHGWLIYFYDKADLSEDPTTKEYVSVTKQLSTALLENAKGKKNGMVFKVGVIDCNGHEMVFCKWKLGDNVQLPTFATVFNGK